MFYSTTFLYLHAFHLIVVIATSQGLSNLLYKFQQDSDCQCFARSLHQQKTMFLDKATVRSYTDCARICTRSKHCEYTWIKEINGEIECELFSLSSNEIVLNKGNSNAIAASLGTSGGSCYKFEQSSGSNEDSLKNNENSQSNNKSTLPAIQWVVFMDTDDDVTQTKTHVRLGEDTHMVAKVVSLDAFGTYTVADIHHMSFLNSNWRGSVVYSIQKDYGGFVKNDACLVMYIFNGNGEIETIYAHPNGSSWETITNAVKLQVLAQNTSEFSIFLKNKGSHLLISNLESGYKLYKYKKIEINYHTLDVYMHYINGDLKRRKRSGYKLHTVPPWYSQYLQVFGKGRAWMFNKIGKVNTIQINKNRNSMKTVASPYWNSLTNSRMDICQRLHVFQDKLILGHRFRVRVSNDFYDVDNLNVVGDEVYFHLPQTITYDSNVQFHNESMEIRSFLTMSGLKSGCVHELEAEDGIPFTDQFTSSDLEIFIDLKTWTAVYSVYSNGTVESGSALLLSNELMTGKDANVLVQWTAADMLKAKAMSVQITTIKDLNKDSILVTSENHAGWYLDNGGQEKLDMTSSCEKEKVLVKSNGEVQILVYNIHSRRNIMTPIDSFKITWFVTS